MCSGAWPILTRKSSRSCPAAALHGNQARGCPSLCLSGTRILAHEQAAVAPLAPAQARAGSRETVSGASRLQWHPWLRPRRGRAPGSAPGASTPWRKAVSALRVSQLTAVMPLLVTCLFPGTNVPFGSPRFQYHRRGRRGDGICLWRKSL